LKGCVTAPEIPILDFACSFYLLHHGIMHIFRLQNYFIKPYFIIKINVSFYPQKLKPYFSSYFSDLKTILKWFENKQETDKKETVVK
jgi:hypothetical protein